MPATPSHILMSTLYVCIVSVVGLLSCWACLLVGARAKPPSARGEAARGQAQGAADAHDGKGGEGDSRRQGPQVSQAVRIDPI